MSCASSLFLQLILVTTMFCCHQFLVIAGNDNTEKQALLEIKAKISDDPLGVLSSWNASLHFCKWHGVTCGRRHRRVTTLDLSNSKLTGILSPHVGNLSFLRELYLQDNSFGGTIPQEINRLYRLQILWLFNNSIGGEIPSNISSCYRLIDISLDNNRLVGATPPELGYLSQLQYLNLARNNLIGVIPSFLGNLSYLVEFHMGGNTLAGKIPNQLGKLRYLEVLILDNNNFFGEIPPSIFNLSSLTKLSLAQNDFVGNLPSYMGNSLPYLRWFSISNNRFTGHIPTSISNASDLEVLSLSKNNLRGQVPSLHKLSWLNYLNLYTNSLGNNQPEDLNFISSLTNATNLEWLQIKDNNFGGVFPKIICNFSSLTYLTLSHNKLDGEIPNCVGNLAKLHFFSAGNNTFTGIIPRGIGNLQNLTYLYLKGNHLSGVIPSSIGNLTKLSTLTLSNNKLEGQIPPNLENCRSLLSLDLSNNKLNGTIPSQLFSLPTMSILLNLSGNHLTGSLPVEVGQLNTLNSLDVSHNMLSDNIPRSLTSCVSLEILYMQENNFNGTIPDALQALKGLRWLDLSHNNLSGEIPKILTSLQLQSLNLSHNNLEGEVPIEGVFKNATGILINGNNRLCGGIPELQLPRCNLSRSNTKKRRLEHRKKLMIGIICGLFGFILLVPLLVSLYSLWKKKETKESTHSDDSGNFSNLSYQTLRKATNEFSKENLIGSGAFGVVYKGTLQESGSIVAIKIFKLDYRGASKSFMAECKVLRSIRHRNLVKVVTTCSSVDYQGTDFKALVYEYMSNGSLDDWLHPADEINRPIEGIEHTLRKLNLYQRLDIAIDVAFALDYLHNHCGISLVHCDLKPSNVLLDGEMVAHVGDFGLAKFLSKGINNSHENEFSSMGVRGTIGYTPPEYGLGNEVSTKGDVYSFGILLLELITGKRPTSDMFKGGVSLHCFVKESLPGHVIETLDRVLLEDIHGQEIDSSFMLETLSSILKVALSCSTEAPQERMDMSNVVAKLLSVRKKLLEYSLRQRRRFQAGSQV
ncbi:probable LRR receptor-like serine/threonine-protein kinase At3g47570 [Chenopodium quinoa]|nr:probable LRR receptor-like serine/threonine-protein kinase At3g47570 [Chenopodium quinoa]